MEKEQSGHCPLLDIDINWPDGSIGNKMYWKPTLTNLYLNMQAALWKPWCTGPELLVTRKICMLSWIFSVHIFRQNSHSNRQMFWTLSPHERWTACRENSASVIFYHLRAWTSTTLTTHEIKYVGLPNKNIYNFTTHCEHVCGYICIYACA
jgi:hypothetical protein